MYHLSVLPAKQHNIQLIVSSQISIPNVSPNLTDAPWQPPEINCVPKYTVARRFGRGTVWYRTDIIIQSYSLYNSFLRENERNFRNYVQLSDLH